MTILVLASLLLIGLVLVLAEILFVPGTTIVGIFGIIVSIAGVYYAFVSFEPMIAWWITALTLLLNLGAIIYGFSSGIWKRFSLKSSMEGGAFDGRTDGLHIGMIGTASSDLKPIGKAVFDEKIYEVNSTNGFIPVESVITIVKIENNKILVR
jgi:membrane-bound ClpP family serine protease